MNTWLLAVILIAAALAVFVLLLAVIFYGLSRRWEDRLMSSAGFAFGYDKPGKGSRYRCSGIATAFEREGNTYRFIVAAHCLAIANDMVAREVILPDLNWWITFDRKKFYQARIVAVGFLWEGDDMAVVEAFISDREIEIISLAESDPYCGEKVVNVAAPSVLSAYADKVFFKGVVCSERFRDTVVSTNLAPKQVRWRNAIYCQIPVGHGSSGSLLISCERGAAVAIVVGMCNTTDSLEHVAICLPISQFKKFWLANKAGTYLYPVKIE